MPTDLPFDHDQLCREFIATRDVSLEICAPLEIEDYVVQPCDDASPPKWHLAHTTWFFETFLLKPYVKNYRPFDESFEYLFNSYYNGVGAQFPRSKRGSLSRPTVAEVELYRLHVNEHMLKLLTMSMTEEQAFKVTLGVHHEQQHQELMLTDLKYNLGHNPTFPVYQSHARKNDNNSIRPLAFDTIQGGIHEIGHDLPSIKKFVFDNESPRHNVLVGDFQIADRPVTNGEYLDFVNDGGYQNSDYWLSDGWSLLSGPMGFSTPLYWQQEDGNWFEYTLAGLQPLDLAQPVTHVSGYEADAYARWAGARLPTEAEWELAAGDFNVDIVGVENFYESGQLHPTAAKDQQAKQFYGDVWEWTSSSYGPYPGFNTFDGQLGEYNGKFMANQLVLRGGSCATARSHIRRSYRNFFYPKDRWQFSGIRLAKDS